MRRFTMSSRTASPADAESRALSSKPIVMKGTQTENTLRDKRRPESDLNEPNRPGSIPSPSSEEFFDITIPSPS